MNKLWKIIAVVCALSVALVTGSMYIRAIRDDIREQKQLNQRLKLLCDQARNTDLTERQRSDFLKRNCSDH